MPFSIDIDVLNTNLYELPINFKIIDENKYSIAYEMQGKKIIRTHQFDSTEFSVDYSINTSLTKIEFYEIS